MKAKTVLAFCLAGFLILGCIGLASSTRDCGNNLNCFQSALFGPCDKATVLVEKEYGTVKLESTGPVWTNIVDSKKTDVCEVNIRVVKVNEDSIPQEQKQMLSDLGIAPDSVSLTNMGCKMSGDDFFDVYVKHSKVGAQKIYDTCSGTLKIMADQVPAMQELMTG